MVFAAMPGRYLPELGALLDAHLVEPLDERPRSQCPVFLGIVRDVGQYPQHMQETHLIVQQTRS